LRTEVEKAFTDKVMDPAAPDTPRWDKLLAALKLVCA
jgi:hypothetical protein